MEKNKNEDSAVDIRDDANASKDIIDDGKRKYKLNIILQY